jgi:hypothetical protein
MMVSAQLALDNLSDNVLKRYVPLTLAHDISIPLLLFAYKAMLSVIG